MGQELKVLNVAEKPSVARALAEVFSRMPGARDQGMRREAHQIFTHESVNFPSVLAQGDGRMIQGPSECLVHGAMDCWYALSLLRHF